MNDNIERALGNIEGTQTQILNAIKDLRDDFQAHKTEDEKQFAALNSDNNRAKGAGTVILALLTAAAAFVGSAVIAVLSGFIKIHA